MTRRDDPILDVCLEQVLGGKSPPDLTARILAAWSREQGAPGGTEGVQPPPVQTASPLGPAGTWSVVAPEPPPIVASGTARETWIVPAERSGAGSGRGRSTKAPGSTWQSVALVGMVLLTGAAVGLVALNLSDKGDSRRVATGSGEGSSDVRTAAGGSPRTNRDGSPRATAGGANSKAPGTRRTADGLASRDGAGRRKPDVAPTPPGGRTAEPATTQANQNSTPPESPAVTLVSNDAVVGRINDALHRAWTTAAVMPAESATDAEWCRRAFLRVIGRIPTVDEVDRYVANRSSAKREELIDDLLGSRYADAYASHWASVWSNVLLGRRDLGSKSAASRDGLQEYLRGALGSDRSFDQVAKELISATGSNRREDEDYNPAVNFLLAHSAGTGVQAAGRVARVFLGARLQCAECHVHPAGSWTQDQLWQFAAFFRQLKQRGTKDGGARLVNEDFTSTGRDPHESASYYELASGELKAAYPVFLDGTPGSRSGLVSEVDRRGELASFVVRSPQFAEATVNRLWAHFLGYGFTQPVDDLGTHNPPSHPELLRQLAGDFAKQGYDLKRLIRWVVLSEPFGLSSKEMTGGLADSPEAGRKPLFARYYPRPMQPEELHKSLQLLVDARGKQGPTTAEQARLLRQLGRSLPSDDPDESRGILQRVPQAVIDAQRDLMSHALADGGAGLVRKVSENQAMSVDEKIDHLFQAALARKPTGQELSAARKLVAESPADVARGLQDIWWVLLNSSEFILDH